MIYTLMFRTYGHGLLFSLEAVLEAAGIPAHIAWRRYAPNCLYVPEGVRERTRQVLLGYWRGLEA